MIRGDKAPCKNTFGGRQSKDLFELNKLIPRIKCHDTLKIRREIKYWKFHAMATITVVNNMSILAGCKKNNPFRN